jgi:hypothetical protein
VLHPPLAAYCRYDIQIIDNYNISLALYNSHVTAAQSIAGIIDCLHFCRPSLGEVRHCLESSKQQQGLNVTVKLDHGSVCYNVNIRPAYCCTAHTHNATSPHAVTSGFSRSSRHARSQLTSESANATVAFELAATRYSSPQSTSSSESALH